MDARKSESKAKAAALRTKTSGGRRESKYSVCKNVVWTGATKSEPKAVAAVQSIRESWRICIRARQIGNITIVEI